MNTEEIRKEIKSQKILLGISLFATAYLIYFGMNNSKWIYYCAVAGAYLLTKSLNYAMEWYRKKKICETKSNENKTYKM